MTIYWSYDAGSEKTERDSYQKDGGFLWKQFWKTDVMRWNCFCVPSDRWNLFTASIMLSCMSETLVCITGKSRPEWKALPESCGDLARFGLQIIQGFPENCKQRLQNGSVYIKTALFMGQHRKMKNIGPISSTVTRKWWKSQRLFFQSPSIRKLCGKIFRIRKGRICTVGWIRSTIMICRRTTGVTSAFLRIWHSACWGLHGMKSGWKKTLVWLRAFT